MEACPQFAFQPLQPPPAKGLPPSQGHPSAQKMLCETSWLCEVHRPPPVPPRAAELEYQLTSPSRSVSSSRSQLTVWQQSCRGARGSFRLMAADRARCNAGSPSCALQGEPDGIRVPSSGHRCQLSGPVSREESGEGARASTDSNPVAFSAILLPVRKEGV